MKGSGYIQIGADIVSWCYGHLLELAPPEHYNPAWRNWGVAVQHLPYPIRQFELLPKRESEEQLRTLLALLQDADSVVHAGDPDREGQMLVDEVLELAGWQGRTERLLINATDPATVRKALSSMRPNSEFRNLYLAARCRSQADWAVGMNMTVAATKLLANDELVSVGRVQTPTLAMIVKRDEQIEKFGAREFYTLEVTVRAGSETFALTYAPSDEDRRIWDVAEAQGAVAELKKLSFVTVTVKTRRKTESPPPLFMLRTFQGEANNRHGWTASKTLEIAQKLYEPRNAYSTYPRTDCPYLPSEQAGQALGIAQMIVSTPPFSGYAGLLSLAAPRPSNYDSSKVTEHHALVPSGKKPDLGSLEKQEAEAWKMLAERFLMNVLPSHTIEETVVSLLSGRYELQATGTVSLNESESWRAMSPFKASRLPEVEDGAALEVVQVRMVKGKTSPPKRYTEKTLLDDMSGVAKYVSDPKLKSILKETSGIGTAATQAAIIETLKERGYVATQKKDLVSTPFGRAVVNALPAKLLDPGLTALWEDALGLVAAGAMSPDAYMASVEQLVKQVVDETKIASQELSIEGSRQLAKGRRAQMYERKKTAVSSGLPI